MINLEGTACAWMQDPEIVELHGQRLIAVGNWDGLPGVALGTVEQMRKNIPGYCHVLGGKIWIEGKIVGDASEVIRTGEKMTREELELIIFQGGTE